MTALRDWFRNPDIRAMIVDADDTIWFDRRYYRVFLKAVGHVFREAGVTEGELGVRMRYYRAREGVSEAAYASGIEKMALELVPHDLTCIREFGVR